MIMMIHENGQIEHIVQDGTPEIDGVKTVTRASNVLPLDPPKRIAFVLLRTIFGDKGRVADWTRKWKGPHIVEVVNGPVLGPYVDRKTALEREVEWLLKNRF